MEISIMNVLPRPDDYPPNTTVYNSSEIAHAKEEIEMYRIQGLEPKYVVLLGQNTTVELRSIGNVHNEFNPPPQYGFEPFPSSAPHDGSATAKSPAQTFRRLKRSVQLLILFVGGLSAVLKLPEILQELLNHLPKLLEHLPF
jgi:hypothetical protein